MHRTLSRAAGTVVLLSLTLAFVPAAQAAPVDTRGGVYQLDVSWFHAVLSWLTGILAPGGHEVMQSSTAADTVVIPPPSWMTPSSGVCVDPGGFGGGGHCNL